MVNSNSFRQQSISYVSDDYHYLLIADLNYYPFMRLFLNIFSTFL